MSRILVTGASGLIGRALVDSLLERGDEVVVLSRSPLRARFGSEVEVHAWTDPTSEPPPASALPGLDGVVHLLGEPIAQRWTPAVKRAIRDSRVLATRQLVHGLRELPERDRPAVLVSQSATGFYGPRGAEILDEQAHAGSDFLADVVLAWEREALAAGTLTRVVTTRTGVVLATDAGALSKMLPFFRLGVGGPVAGGRQYVPWIHLADLVGGLLKCLDDPQLEGAVNLTAPEPVTNAQLSRTLGRTLRRPALLPVPEFAVRALYGEMATVVTTGQRAVPARLLAAGHHFTYTALEPALQDLLG
ncbi:MAG: TIGR01777 family oxidoreductase [Solirubrobacteraceae bacterium]